MSDALCKKCYASICLYGDNLDPEYVTDILGVQPTNSHKKGDPWGIRKRLANTEYWGITSTGDSTNLESHIWQLLPQLGTNKPNQIKGVDSCRVFCYWLSRYGHGGPIFSPKLLQTLAVLELPLELDFYYHPPIDESEEQP